MTKPKITILLAAFIIASLLLAANAYAARVIGFNQMQFGSDLSLNGSTLTLYTANSSRIFVSNNGLVGINTTSPAQTLTVQGTLNVTPAGQMGNASLFVTSGGNVGIGTSAPLAALHIKRNSNPITQDLLSLEALEPGLTLNATRTDNGKIVTAWTLQNQYPASSGFSSLYLNQNGVTRVAFDRNGSVGIGQTNPSYLLEVASGTDGRSVNLSNVLYVNGSNGNVGIGTTTPNDALEVVGNVRVSGSLNATSINVTRFTANSFITNNLTVNGEIKATGFVNFTNNTAFNQTLYLVNGNVGIGTTSPNYLLQTASGTDGRSVNLSNVLYVNGSNGRVGIGTASPGNNIGSGGSNIGGTIVHVRDTASTAYVVADGISETNFVLAQNDGSANERIAMWRLGAGVTKFISMNDNLGVRNDNILVMNLSNGRVGIGTTSPLGKLDIFRAAGQSGTAALVLSDGETGGSAGRNWALSTEVVGVGDFAILESTAAGGTPAPTSSNVKFYIDINGNVGIGTTTPAFTLDITGTLRTTGAKTGFLGDIIKNDGDEPLEKGDLVSISFNGVDENMTGNNIPIFKAVKAKSKNDINIVGVVFEKSPESPKNNESNNSLINKGEQAIIATHNSITFLKATNENGKILPGDYLTASSKAGYAMKADENSIVLIGRALEPLSGSEGVISAFIQITTSNAISNINEERLLEENDSKIGELEDNYKIDLKEVKQSKASKETKLERIKKRLQLEGIASITATDYMERINGSVIIRLG